MTAKLCPRPKTTKRYVHPPYSERMFTLWAEGKVVFGEHGIDLETANIMEDRVQRRMVSCAIWPVLGRDMIPFDFRTVKNGITEDGTPIHTVEYKTENLTFSKLIPPVALFFIISKLRTPPSILGPLFCAEIKFPSEYATRVLLPSSLSIYSTG